MDRDLLIGIDFGGTKIECAAIEADGAVLARHRAATPRGDYPGSIACVVELVTAVERELRRSGSVGVGIPGTISANGRVKNANSVWLNHRPFHRDLAEALGRPVRVENDANCFTLSEAFDGAAAGQAVVFGVILGTGCGGGLAVDGRLIGGRNRIAGEWGHNPLPWPSPDEFPGPACWCGKSGCLETWISGPALAAGYRRATGRVGVAEDLVAAMRSGEAAARSIFVNWRDRLARGLAHVVNLVDPDVIVLGGGLSLIAEAYEGLQDQVARWVFSDAFTTPILRGRHGDSSGVFGAARLWA